jgi:hypothetical protein
MVCREQDRKEPTIESVVETERERDFKEGPTSILIYLKQGTDKARVGTEKARRGVRRNEKMRIDSGRGSRARRNKS